MRSSKATVEKVRANWRCAISTALALFAALSLFVPHAHAQSDAEKELAKKHFAEGEQLFAKGEFNSAAAAFTKAYRIAPHPTVLANVALSYDKAGEVILALRAYNKYLEENEDSAIRKRKAELESYVGRLRITCSVDPCRIAVDSKPMRSDERVTYVMPGRHWIEASSAGYPDAAVEVVVHAGELSEIGMTFKEPSTENAAPPEQNVASEDLDTASTPLEVDEKSSVSLGAPFWISASIAVAAGAGTIFFGVRTLQAKEEFDKSGQTDETLAETGKQYRLATNILLSVTAAAVATAASFAIYDLRFKNRKATAALAPGPGFGAAAVLRF